MKAILSIDWESLSAPDEALLRSVRDPSFVSSTIRSAYAELLQSRSSSASAAPHSSAQSQSQPQPIGPPSAAAHAQLPKYVAYEFDPANRRALYSARDLTYHPVSSSLREEEQRALGARLRSALCAEHKRTADALFTRGEVARAESAYGTVVDAALGVLVLRQEGLTEEEEEAQQAQQQQADAPKKPKKKRRDDEVVLRRVGERELQLERATTEVALRLDPAVLVNRAAAQLRLDR